VAFIVRPIFDLATADVSRGGGMPEVTLGSVFRHDDILLNVSGLRGECD
jgi:hypothetical protein